MNVMPGAADSQAVLAVVTWMKAYQLLPCAVTIGCQTAGMTTPNRPQAIRPAGVSVSSQPNGVGGAQLLTRIDAPALAAQPLAIEQMRAGEFGTEPGTAQPIDRFAIEVVGGRTVDQ